MKPTFKNSVACHQLGFPRALDNSENALISWLETASRLGYGNIVLVPLLLTNISPAIVSKRLKDHGMLARTCFLNTSTGPNPFKEPKQTGEALLKQITYHQCFSCEGVSAGPTLGPVHTWHMCSGYEAAGGELGQMKWLDHLARMCKKENCPALVEGLNPFEDPTPHPFSPEFIRALRERGFGTHIDSNHVWARDKDLDQLLALVSEADYLEVVQLRRRSLENGPIPTARLLNAFKPRLGKHGVGIERFSREVIDAFNLGFLCDPCSPDPETDLLESRTFMSQHLFPEE